MQAIIIAITILLLDYLLNILAITIFYNRAIPHMHRLFHPHSDEENDQ